MVLTLHTHDGSRPRQYGFAVTSRSEIVRHVRRALNELSFRPESLKLTELKTGKAIAIPKAAVQGREHKSNAYRRRSAKFASAA